MIQNYSILERFNQQQLVKENYSYAQALKIFESLYSEAKALGVIGRYDLSVDLEPELRVARILQQSCHV